MTLPDCDCGEAATIIWDEPVDLDRTRPVAVCSECRIWLQHRADNGPPDAGEDDGPLSLDEQHRQAHAMRRAP